MDLLAGERPSPNCLRCGADVAGETIPDGARMPACATCRAALASLPAAVTEGTAEPTLGPVACSTPFADFGVVAGLHVQLLAIERWPEHAALYVAFNGPPGWLDVESGPLRGRVDVIGAEGVSVSGMTGSGGGSERLSIHEIALPSLNAVAGPWTIRLTRWGEYAEVSARPEDLRPLTALRAVVLEPVVPGPPEGLCMLCRTSPVGHRHACDRCLGILTGIGQAYDSSTAMPLAHGQPLVHDIGDVGSGRLVLTALEQRDGWFSIRYHLAQNWESHNGGYRGWWTAIDDAGNRFEGVEDHSDGDVTGWVGQVSFPGCIDPTSRQLTLIVCADGQTVLEVDLPLDATSTD